MPVYFHDAWLDHVHGEYERGISVTEKIKQERVQNEEHYLDLLSQASGHCYVTNHVFNKWRGIKTVKTNPSPRIYKIYIDLDADPKKGTTILDAYKDYRILINWIKKMETPAQGVFSGGKGFNIYLFTGPEGVQLKRPKLIIGTFINKLTTLLNLKTVDRKTTVDIMRITRIPFTKHAKSGYYCIPVTRLEKEVDYDIESLGAVIGNARLPNRQFVNDHPLLTPDRCFGHGLAAHLEELDTALQWQGLATRAEQAFPEEEYEEPVDSKPFTGSDLPFLTMEDFGITGSFDKTVTRVRIAGSSNLFPCLKAVWKKAVNDGIKPGHVELLAIALFYKNRKGKTLEEVKQIFANLDHNSWYDQEKVNDQLYSIFVKGDYEFTTSCQKLREDASEICLEEKCHIYKKYVINK
jgi:hypothetical protein